MISRDTIKIMTGTLAMAMLLALSTPLAAQEPVPVTISQQKMVVAGRSYYLHQVQKGQTLYSIARAYSVTVELLSIENELEGNEIKEDQVLRIPVAVSAQGQAAVKSAESRVTPAEVVPDRQQAYPDERAAQRQPEAAVSERQTPQQQGGIIYHRVSRGDSFGSIAARYGITVRELRRHNRGVLFPREGDRLMIPGDRVTAEQRHGYGEPEEEPDTALADTLLTEMEGELFTRPGERSRLDRLTGSVRVAALLPFYLWENSTRTYIDSAARDQRGNVIYREMTRDATEIYEGSLPFLETYEGILLAADSLRSLGLAIELDVYDTRADSTVIRRLINSGALDNADLIIGPVFSANLEHASAWAATRDIPIVSPVPLRDPNILERRPTLYRVYPSDNVVQDVIVREVGNHPDARVIFLYADSAMYEPGTLRFWEKLSESAGRRQFMDTTRLLPLYFTGMTDKRNVYSNVATLESVLDPGRKNLVVLATTRTPVVSTAFSALHSLIKKYEISVIGFPGIRDLETIDLKYYYDLDLYIPSVSYVDFESPEVQAFTASFMKKFRTEPMAESYAWRGFDIAWYFIGGVASGGSGFLRDPGTFNPYLLSLEPVFRRNSRDSGYENGGMFMLHYRRDMTIEVTRPWSYSYDSDAGGDSAGDGDNGDNGDEKSLFTFPFRRSSEPSQSAAAGRRH